MVNYCVCGDCINSGLSVLQGRVHKFPLQEKGRCYSLSFVPGAVCAGEETGFLFCIGFGKRGRVSFTSDQMIIIPAINMRCRSKNIDRRILYQWHQIV